LPALFVKKNKVQYPFAINERVLSTISSFQINNINQYLKSKKISCQAKYIYSSLLLEKQTFLPFYTKIEVIAEDFTLDKRHARKVLKVLEESKLLKRMKGTIDTKDRKIGNSLFLQLVPPQPFRLLKGEFIQLDKKPYLNKLFQTICLKKIRDLNDNDFEQGFHFIHFSNDKYKEALEEWNEDSFCTL
jgi:hypothetical protein